jgi:hypothetical protein
MDEKVSLVRTLISTATPVIDWSYEFYNYASNEGKDIDRRKDPAMITTNPKDPAVFYLSGRYEGKASVMKF